MNKGSNHNTLVAAIYLKLKKKLINTEKKMEHRKLDQYKVIVLKAIED